MDGDMRMNWQSIRKILKKIFCLSPIQTLLIAVPSYLFVIYVLSGGAVHQAVAYIAYLLSANAFVILAVHNNSGFSYPGLLIYAMALYTFYAAITAVINVVKYRRYESPILSAAKVISLTAALVSVLSLETAMLAQFGGADDPAFRQIMTASTGTGVSLTVLGMAGVMIVRSTKQLKQIKQIKQVERGCGV